MIRTQEQARRASRAELDAAHLAYRGEALLAQMSDAAARVAVSMAILSAEAAHGRIGIPKGTRPQPLTLKERRRLMAKANTNYPAGTIAAELKAQRTPEPDPNKPALRPRQKIERVRATGAGTTRLQANSIRAQVMRHIPSDAAGITVEALDAACGFPTRPHLQKLLEVNHIEALSDEQD